jgi:hypothetical protein
MREIAERMGVSDSLAYARLALLRLEGRQLRTRCFGPKQEEVWAPEKDDELRRLWRMQPALRVVEIAGRKSWSPVGAPYRGAPYRLKASAKELLGEWRLNNPNDRFRIAKYQRVEPKEATP